MTPDESLKAQNRLLLAFGLTAVFGTIPAIVTWNIDGFHTWRYILLGAYIAGVLFTGYRAGKNLLQK